VVVDLWWLVVVVLTARIIAMQLDTGTGPVPNRGHSTLSGGGTHTHRLATIDK
jgi:hypothetical protein